MAEASWRRFARHTSKRGKNALIGLSLLRWRGYATAGAVNLMFGFALLGASGGTGTVGHATIPAGGR